MIRIHAGTYKNRKIKRVFEDSTRETASLVREAVFNMLYEIEGNVLDLFAGSGSYGITALSFGATSCTFIDNNIKAITTIKDNVSSLGIKNFQVYKTDYLSFLKHTTDTFDLIFLDPPYAFADYEMLLNDVSNVATNSAIIVLETNKMQADIESFSNFRLVKSKQYGTKKIQIYHYQE